VFTIGNGRPLDQALQFATAEMLAWLVQDYGFDERSVCILLGQCVEFDIANVFNPAYSAVC
jgi:amidase